jgi:hypothetical protein
MPDTGSAAVSVTPPTTAVATAVVEHHLRLFGVAANRRVRIRLLGGARQLASCGIDATRIEAPGGTFRFPAFAGTSWSQARTLHGYETYQSREPHQVHAVDASGRACWISIRRGGDIDLFIGTDIAADLCRYRQGDPARIAERQTEPMWGIPGERPTYLFEQQQPPGTEKERQADWWSMALAQTVAGLDGRELTPMLPGGAPGALVITGDDDQAYLEKYRDQIQLLNGLPVTYFLHPLTRHSRETIRALRSQSRVELGLHPDALDRPDAYFELYRAQAAWFSDVFGDRPTLVRNHGFLNDGYWGHLPVWLEQGVIASSNIPGVNARILNGSLLPARVAIGDSLSPHWSILTAIGDGIRFALGADGPAAARCITGLAADIIDSRLPGVMVLNLHPQNVAETVDMHRALHEVAAMGFVAMTFGECINWFAARDRQNAA